MGTCGISALLVTSDDGHILVDAATPQAGPQILTNIRALGFKPEDVRVIADDEVVKVGPLALQAIPTPGHTPGGTSWTWRSCEGDDCQQIVYADSLTAISDDSYRFSEHPDYVAAFRDTLGRVAALDCDILVTPHPSASNLWSRIGPQASKPLVDSGACRGYANYASQRLDKRLADEAAAPQGKTP